MTNKELRQLSRRELIELLIKQKIENEFLEQDLKKTQEKLKNREIVVRNAGSMAEAALQLNGVFNAVDAASKQYLENIARYSEAKKNAYRNVITEIEKKAKEIIDEAEAEKQKRIREADEYWTQMARRLEDLYNDRTSLDKLIAIRSAEKSGDNE